MAVKQLRTIKPPSLVRTPPPSEPTPRRQVQTMTYGDLQWIDIQHPTPTEMNELRQSHQFHPLALEDCLSKVQRPKLDEYTDDGYLFLVLHFPVFNKQTRHTEPAEVDIFVGRSYVVTVHRGELKPLVQMFATAQEDEPVRARMMARGSGYLLYRIIDRLVDYCFPILNKIDEHIEKIESEIIDGNVRVLVQNLSFVRRDIITLRRIIKPNLPVLRQLESRERAFLRLDEDIYFGDILDHLSKQWDMLEDDKEIIEGLNDTLDSLTSHRINEVMKILTVISVVLLPMTLVASVYGMNVALPLDQHPLAFPFVVGLMLLAAVGMMLYFRFKGWV